MVMTESKMLKRSQNDNNHFAILAAVLQVALIVLFAVFVEYPVGARKRDLPPQPSETKNDTTAADELPLNSTSEVVEIQPDAPSSSDEVNLYYPMFQDVHTMIFVGFGFLMTFLKRYSYSSVGLNLLLAAFAVEWTTIVFGLLHRASGESKIFADMFTLINAEFTAGTVLISFGAVLGKTTPFQLLFMTLLEVLISKICEYICAHSLHATDIGGSMFIHAFGAYFGLAVSAVLCYRRRSHLENENEVATKTSDVFAMIGTVFLWMFWPSFNGALAVDALRQRAIINTYFSLAGAAVVCFTMSAIVEPRNRFNMVHIQNASLAGGVAIGTCADMLVGPYMALIIGCFAAFVSVMGYRYLTPRLNKRIHDTCGVHNLHGMPGLIGALSGVIFAGLGYYDANPTSSQAVVQITSLGVVLGFALGGGLLVGILLRLPLFRQINDYDEFFNDVRYWHVPMAHSDDAHIVGFSNGKTEEEIDDHHV